jgi:hypothetical protein
MHNNAPYIMNAMKRYLLRGSRAWGALAVALAVFGFAGSALAWSGPTANPPGNNVATPLNVGTSNQVKNAGLSVNALAVFGNTLLGGIAGSNVFLNFGATPGSAGYGIWDNGGTLNFKNSNGSWQSLQAIVSGLVGSNGVTGSGSTNYVPRWTGASSLGNASISSDGVSSTANGNFFVTGTTYDTNADVSGTLHAHGVGTDTWFPYTNGWNYIRGPTNLAGVLYDEQNNGDYLDMNQTSVFNSLTLSNLNTLNCVAGTCPPNGAIRMTPNFHLNAGQGYAVIVNWDNGTTGGAQAFRVGNGAGADAFYVTANGQAIAGANVQTPTLCLNGDCRSAWPSTALPGNNTLWDTWYGSAYLASNGDYYMGWDGRWLSQTINQDVRNGASPTFGETYTNGWFRLNGNGGIYWQAWNGGLYMSDGYWIRAYNNNGIWLGSGNFGTNGGLTVGYGGAGVAAGGAIFSNRVGIGTQGPDQLLTVAGIVHSTSGGFQFPDGSVQTTAIKYDSGRTQCAGSNPLGAQRTPGTGTGANGATLTPVNFNKTFSSPPVVTGTYECQPGQTCAPATVYIGAGTITTTSFQADCYDSVYDPNAGTAPGSINYGYIDWIAIGN